MLSFTHHTDSWLRPPIPWLAKGSPLSLSRSFGNPNSRNAASMTSRTLRASITATAPAFEIDTPYLVGRLRMTQWIQAWAYSAVTLRRHCHASSYDQFTDGAGCRPNDLRRIPLQPGIQFLRTP